MCVEVDPLYLDNLSEWIHDEHKLVTYLYLSVNLKVHANLAKQMLYEFYQNEKKKQANVRALYYISGIKEADHSYAALVCRDEELDNMKSKFTTISSLHIYGLEDPLPSGEGEKEGTVDKLCKAMDELNVELEEEVGVSPVVVNVPMKSEKQGVDSKKDHDEQIKGKISKKPMAPTLFGSLCKSKPKVETADLKPKTSTMFSSAAKSKVETANLNKNNIKQIKSDIKLEDDMEVESVGKVRSRKRIQIVDSDSSDEEPILVKAPTRKRKQIVDSENSDEEIEETISKKPKASAATLFAAAPKPKAESVDLNKNIKQKKMKTVMREYTDEEGYRVTKKEHVLVSEGESDNEKNEEKESTKANGHKQETKVKLVSPPTAKVKMSSAKKPSNKSLLIQQKQASILSYFSKQ